MKIMNALNQTTRLNSKIVMFSKATSEQSSFRLLFKSEFGMKKDVFINQNTGNIVFRDSIRRKFF